MNTRAARLFASALALATTLALGSFAARAQAPDRSGARTPDRSAEQAPSLEEIIVEAPWRIERKVVGRTSTGGKIEDISLQRRVDYSDLDLSRTADAMELEKRINDVAKDSCDALAKMFPLERPDIESCVKRAVQGAMAQEQQAIAAAGKGENKEVATAPAQRAR